MERAVGMLSTWITAALRNRQFFSPVQLNYHIACDKMNYSVPYEYIKHTVDVRLTQNMVEIFYQGNRIASHKRLYGHPGQYSTVCEHMPEKHRQYAQWNSERFIRWACDIGPHTEQTVKAIIASRKIEQQSYKTCIALLKLSDMYSSGRLEAACEKALSYSSCPSFRSIRTILKTGSDKRKTDAPQGNDNDGRQYAFTRGTTYYAGGKNDDE